MWYDYFSYDRKVVDTLTDSRFIDHVQVPQPSVQHSCESRETVRIGSRLYASLTPYTIARELATFYENTRSSSERSYATYLISGEAFAKASNVPDVISTQGSSVDIDATPSQGAKTNNSETDDGEVVPELRMTLVTEQELEGTSHHHYIPPRPKHSI